MKVVKLNRTQLLDLLGAVLPDVEEVDLDPRIYEARIGFDDGVKVKVNNGTWGPPLGTVEP